MSENSVQVTVRLDPLGKCKLKQTGTNAFNSTIRYTKTERDNEL